MAFERVICTIDPPKAQTIRVTPKPHLPGTADEINYAVPFLALGSIIG